MATIIIIKTVKEALAIPSSSVNLIHNPCGVDFDLLVNYLCSNHFIGQVSSIFVCLVNTSINLLYV